MPQTGARQPHTNDGERLDGTAPGDPDGGGLVKVAMTVHNTLANLVWAYLIGHALMALTAHYWGALSLHQMWSLRRHPEA